MWNYKRHLLKNQFDLRKGNMEFVNSMCKKLRHFWEGTLQMKRPPLTAQMNQIF